MARLLLDKYKAVIRPGSLVRLELRGYGLISQNVLQIWSKHVDLSTLRILKLQSDVQGEALSWAVANCNLHSLTTLVLEKLPAGDWHHISNSFFRSMLPLTTLRVGGNLSRGTFEAIVEHHGKFLRQLWLSSTADIDQLVFKHSQIDKIRQHCLILEDLTLPVPRSKGDAQELAIYRTLGALPKLQKLFLILDSSNLSVLVDNDLEVPNDASFDEFGKQFFPLDMRITRPGPRNGHVRAALINSALDETLARAIFQTISTSKARNAFPLEYLKLRPIGGGVFGKAIYLPGLSGSDGLAGVLSNIGRSWLLVRNPRDDCRVEVIAKQLGWREREGNKAGGYRPLSQALKPIFRKIWPKKQDTTGAWHDDWYNDWYSWPLPVS